MNDEYKILRGDCLDRMRELDDGSIDAIVTDPPYGLSFMGKEWDRFGSDTRQPGDEHYNNASNVFGRSKVRYGYGSDLRNSMFAFQEAMTPIFEEALRVAKPGANLLCFGGTRTFHRMTCAIEDAGWEIRDCIMWVYGSGFPKSMDVSKAIDKALGAKREKVDGGKGPAYQRSIGNTRPWMFEENHQIDGPVPATAAAAAWDGWGTCLKLAWEPIIVARKPLDGTVAHNVMTYGTGAINIDGCRVPTAPHDSSREGEESSERSYGDRGATNFHNRPGPRGGDERGRFPANLVHDGSDEVLAMFPDTGKSIGGGMHTRGTAGHEATNTYGAYAGGTAVQSVGVGDSGSAARFFYCAKASKDDRGEGNDHPTVKPNDLMRWLVRLVCPKGGVILDPFMGSGSTGVAAMDEEMLFVGIDKDEHYCDVADQRIRRKLDGGIQRSMF